MYEVKEVLEVEKWVVVVTLLSEEKNLKDIFLCCILSAIIPDITQKMVSFSL